MKAIRLLILSVILLVSFSGAAQETSAGDSAVTPATDNAISSQAATNVGCLPACRSGFLCHAGMCVSKCNPPCGSGYICTGEGECMAEAVPPPPQMQPQNDVYMARERARMEARKKKELVRQHRQTEVQKLRLGLHMDWQWSFANVYRTGFVGNIGLQKNVASSFALRARVGGMLGYARSDFFAGDERSGCWGVNFDVAPLFGPLGRFYIGPAFWLAYYWYKKDQLENDYTWDDTTDIDVLEDGITGGIALDMGILVGPEYNLGVSWRLKSTLLADDTNFIFEFGLAYHFPVGS